MAKLEGELIILPVVGGIGVKLTEKKLRVPVKVTVDEKTGEVRLSVDPEKLK